MFKALLLLLACPLLAASVSVAGLQSFVEGVAASDAAQAQARWAVHVTQLQEDGSWRQLADVGASKLSVPASNNKLLSTAAAFWSLGPAFRFRTLVSVRPESRVLCVRPEGDPSVSPGALAAWAAKLPQYRGWQVRVDDSFFQGRFPDSWEYGDLAQGYGALPVAPVLRSREELEENRANAALLSVAAGGRVTFAVPSDAQVVHTSWSGGTGGASHSYRLGSSTLRLAGVGDVVAAVREPELRYAAAFAAAMGSSSFSVDPACSVGAAHNVSFYSAPLLEIMNHTLQYSDNLYAELFLRQLAQPGYADAIARARSILTEGLGVPADSFSQGDGSGLSRRNLVAPVALTTLLHSLYANATYREMLPLAGVSGTLARRFIGTPAEGHLYAKTGTLTGVNSLSGYVMVPGNATLAFSIIVNHSLEHSSQVRTKIDEIGVALASLQA